MLFSIGATEDTAWRRSAAAGSDGRVAGRGSGLEAELGELLVVRDPGRVAAREAGSAELRRGPGCRGLRSFEREVGERRGADLLSDLVDRAGRGDKLLLVGEVDPVETRRD